MCDAGNGARVPHLLKDTKDVRILDDLIAERHANEANSREMLQIQGAFVPMIYRGYFLMIINLL